MFLCEIVLLWSCPSGSMWDTHCFRLTVFHCISQLICWLQTSWRQKPWHVVRFLSPGCPRLLTHSGIKWCHPQGQSCRSCLCAQQTKIDSEMWEHNSQGQQVTAEKVKTKQLLWKCVRGFRLKSMLSLFFILRTQKNSGKNTNIGSFFGVFLQNNYLNISMFALLQVWN